MVNVVDLMTLQPDREHPHGLPDKEFDALFTTDKPIIFVFHGYPWLIHRLTYSRAGHRNLHVRGYKEEGTTTTPFDMAVRNDIDRFHLVNDVIDRVPQPRGRLAKQAIRDALPEHKEYIERRGDDLPRIRDWRRGSGGGVRRARADTRQQRLKDYSPTQAVNRTGTTPCCKARSRFPISRRTRPLFASRGRLHIASRGKKRSDPRKVWVCFR